MKPNIFLILLVFLVILVFSNNAQCGPIDQSFENEVKRNAKPASEYNHNTLTNLIQLTIDAHDLQKYFHFKKSTQNESLKMVLSDPLPNSLPLRKNGVPVYFPTAQEIYQNNKFDFIAIDEILMSDSKAVVYFGYPIQAVIGRIYFIKKNDTWKIKNEWIARSSSYSRSRLSEARKCRAAGDLITLTQKLKNSDPHMRECALRSICDMKNIRVNQIIVNALNDSEPKVRMIAITYIGKRKISGSVTVLIKALKDQDKRVAAMAQNAIGNLGDQKALPALIESLKRDLDFYGYGSGIFNDSIRVFDNFTTPYATELLITARKKAKKSRKIINRINHILSNMGNRFLDLHQWDNAIKVYEGLTTENTKDGEPWFLLGVSYLNRGKYNINFGIPYLNNKVYDTKKMIHIFSQAINRGYGDDRLFLFRGDFYFNQGKFKKAFADYNIFYSKRPNYEIARIRMCRVNFVLGNILKAENICFDKYKQPVNKRLFIMNRAHIHLLKGEVKKAKDIYKQLIKNNDSQSKQLYIRAITDDLTMFKDNNFQKNLSESSIKWIIDQWD